MDRAGISLLSSVKWGDGTGLWGGHAGVPKQGQTFSFHVGAGRSGGWGTPELSVLLCLVGRGISRSGAGPRGGLAVSTSGAWKAESALCWATQCGEDVKVLLLPWEGGGFRGGWLQNHPGN